MVKMKPWPIISLILIVLASVGAAAYYVWEASIMGTPSLCRDPNNISSHVYNPARLQTIRECITVSGIVNNVIVEDDGDYHVWFHVDPQYASLPNRANNDYRQGDLLAEIICATTITQQDAVLACENYTNQILPIPNSNQNITVTGPYVLNNVYGWMEVHPVYFLSIS
ncbi:hypothetical protein E6H13_05945 [Candidatus Bathyarchaeota archaeon]|nr:MAG: hypothetical protein E6H13_05945 [Candidatus Bathyarchaeota archaeon]